MKMQSPVPALVIILTLVSSAGAWPIREDEAQGQNTAFAKWWGSELVWKFDELPVDGSVDSFRYPYAGAIYPDSVGGTAYVLRKYDRAFHRGRSLAESFEYHDIRVHQQQTVVYGGLFGMRAFSQMSTPYWAGHCNGWAAAAIRHAEPMKNVTRNGVVFTPADIKGLLAELYVYSSIEHLGGVDRAINPGTLHVVLCNWLGRNQYPIAWDSTIGTEIWNYPVYAFRSSNAKRRNNQVEVKMNVGYVNYTQREYNVAPDRYRYMYFHYTLTLDSEGRITGGDYHRDSNRVDMLWVPLRPTPGGTPGNQSGNPHLDVNEVLAMWRESAAADLRQKWYTIDAPEEDQVERASVVELDDSEGNEESGTAEDVANEDGSQPESAAQPESASSSADTAAAGE